MDNIKNKKVIIALIVVGIISIIGGTLAYYNSSSTFDNVFHTANYQIVTTEVFKSPTNWMPGDVTPKTITVKNEGDINARVRICIDNSSWLAKDGTTELQNYSYALHMNIAIINEVNTNDWFKDDNCYYYKNELAPNETTSSPIESVTFNPLYSGDVSCTPNIGNTVTCESSNTGYDGAVYTLTLRAETVQSDGLSSWGMGYSIDGSNYNLPDSGSAVDLTGYDTFLKSEFTNDGIIRQVGFRYNNNDYYLISRNQSKYNDNKTVLDNSLGASKCHNDINQYVCKTDNLDAAVSADGSVKVIHYKTNSFFICEGNEYDNSCYEANDGYSSTGKDHFTSAEEAMNASGHLSFLKYQINGKDTTSSVGFKLGNNIYYIVSSTDGSSYNSNKAILNEAFGSSNCEEDGTGYYCENIDFYAKSYIDGPISIKELNDDNPWTCSSYGAVSSICGPNNDGMQK